MTKAFQVELKKARHRHDLLLCLLVPVLMIIWVGGLSPSSPEELANGYSALFYSVPVINTIILPVMMSLLSSRLWDMEVKGNCFIRCKAAEIYLWGKHCSESWRFC